MPCKSGVRLFTIFDPVNTQETYISDFGQVILYIVGGALFIAISLLMARLIRPHRPNPQKLATYESGEEAISSAWTQFNIRFYLIALIFILFEVEVLFLFPWTTVFAKKELIEETGGRWGWFSVIEMVIFIGVLALGLAYAWVNGHLDWVKPDPSPTQVKSPVPPDLYAKINEQYAAEDSKK
jgi:NADH-quinone oxidoreductase subunit A